MNDKEYKEQKKRIKKLIKKWVKPLGLNWWRIVFNYKRDKDMEDVTDYHPKTINGRWMSAFTTTADHCYLTASIDCFIPILQNLEDDDLEEYFVHELMHIFLRPMHTKGKAGEEELVATQLAKAFIWSKINYKL